MTCGSYPAQPTCRSRAFPLVFAMPVVLHSRVLFTSALAISTSLGQHGSRMASAVEDAQFDSLIDNLSDCSESGSIAAPLGDKPGPIDLTWIRVRVRLLEERRKQLGVPLPTDEYRLPKDQTIILL